MEVFEQLNSVFCRVFDDNDIKTSTETTANDIDGWDSLSHVNLVVAIEKHFGIKFRSSEIMKWKNVGMMHDSIVEKLSVK